MKVIKCLVKAMYCELKAADMYYHKAVEFQEEFPQVAATYNEIANQELQHCEKFHAMAVATIAKIKASGTTEVPAAMQAIWDYEHTNVMEEYDELKYKISKFTI